MRIYRSLSILKEVPQVKKADKVVLVTSASLKRRFDWETKDIEKQALPRFKIVTVRDGEKAKDWDVLKKLLVRFTKLKLTKRSVVIAFGGGSVSDLVGFACSIYKRGAISYINVPTTLLAQVDASIGGKTAIDFLGIKNLLGSFYEPVAVFIISDFLKSLSEEQFIDGLAEIIKVGFIRSTWMLDFLESQDIAELRKKPHLLEEIIFMATDVKRRLVRIDPKDKRERQALNVGHTAGHAYELDYGLSHGRAVLLGMMYEFKLAKLLRIKVAPSMLRFCKLMERLGINLPSKPIKIRSVMHDKKISGKEIIFPVVSTPGDCELVKIRLDKFMAAVKKCNQKQH